MGETGAFGVLVAGTHAIYDGASRQRGGVVLMHKHVQTVGQYGSCKGYGHNDCLIFEAAKIVNNYEWWMMNEELSVAVFCVRWENICEKMVVWKDEFVRGRALNR
jgi:hypothetical protein